MNDAARLTVVLLASVALGLAGCGIVGPLTAPDAPQRIAAGAALAPNDVVRLYARADWLPQTYSFTGIWLGTGTEPTAHGALVCTDQRAVFVVWNEEESRYEGVLNLPYTSLRSVELKKFGRARRITMIGTDSGLNSFDVVGSNGVLYDQEMADKMATCLTIRWAAVQKSGG